MIKSFFKDYVIVWHDPDLNSQENQHALIQLEKFCQVFSFTEWQKASSFIKETEEICHGVTSGTNGELLVKEIFSALNISNIYIFCRDKDFHLSWAKNYLKISCVETDIQKVTNQIQQNLLEWYKEKSSLKLNLPAFAPIFNDSDKSEMNNLHRYLKVLPKFKNRQQAKEDFINLSKNIYTDPHNLKFIAAFEQSYNDYNKEEVLRWYTLESFLFKVTNNCLRIATSDSIQYCRLLLKDLQQAIKEQYQTQSKNFSGLLYRGAYLSDSEWSNLKENLNQEVEMHGFLSVSKTKKIGLNFMKLDPSKKVFITIIVPKGPNEEKQGFAEIDQFSDFPMEKEVLFNVRSRFTVLETEDDYEDSETTKCRHLVLLYGAQGFRRFLTEKNPIQEVFIPSAEDISCAECQGKAQEMPGKVFFISLGLQEDFYYCEECIDNASRNTLFVCITPAEHIPHIIEIKGCLLKNPTNLPMYGYRCSKCQVKKQKRYFTCIDCSSRWCKNCCSPRECLEANHHILLETSALQFWFMPMSATEMDHLRYQNDSITNNNIDEEFQQAEMYFANHKYEKAIEFYTSYIQKRGTKKNDPWLAVSYKNIGVVYNDKGEYRKALEYYFKAHEIFKVVYGEKNEHFATSCSNIGLAYSYQEEYNKALEYYFKALKLEKSLHGEKHAYVATVQTNIGLVYYGMRDYTKSLEYCLGALDLRKSLFGENHLDIATSYSNIGLVYDNLREYNKALDYYSQALEIRKAIYGENHPLIALAYSNSALTYKNLGETKKALEYQLQALGIRNSLFKENHPDVAESYDHIGFLYDTQGEYEKGLDYHWRSLRIKKAIHGGESHPLVGQSYSNLGFAYSGQKDYKKALEYYLKSLEIFKTSYGENHVEVARAYDNVGLVYDYQKSSQKSLEYYSKALEMRISIYGEKKHSDLAACYLKIGNVYYAQEAYSQALESYLKCAEIEMSLYGENHADVASSYYNIGYVYYLLEQNIKGLEYLNKSLTIRKSLFGENHSLVALCYNSIGLIYNLQKDSKKSLEYHMKALEIRKSLYEENHADIAMSYNNIGLAYDNQEEYEKGLEYHQKSLNIKLSVFGENDILVGDSYHNAGFVYTKLGDRKKALEYFAKALEIEKLVYGSNHAKTIKTQNKILEMQRIYQEE